MHIWSLAFLVNHHAYLVSSRHIDNDLTAGSQQYIQIMTRSIPSHSHSCPTPALSSRRYATIIRIIRISIHLTRHSPLDPY